MNTESKKIVIDIGSSLSKVGFSGYNQPIGVFHTMVGRPKYKNSYPNSEEIFLGNEAYRRRSSVTFKKALENGMVLDFASMEKLWDHSFKNELKVDPKENGVIYVIPPNSPIEDKQEIAEYFFKKYQVPDLSFVESTLSSLYAYGKATGFALEIGEDCTHVGPYYDGLPLKGRNTHYFGGKNLTEYMIDIIGEKGYSFTSTSEKLIIKEIKEAHAYVSLDYDRELQVAKKSTSCDITYVMPDEEEIIFSSERFRCPELLFNTVNTYVSNNIAGIHTNCFDSIMKSDPGISRDLFSNIVLSGGSTMFRNLPERLEKEINNLLRINNQNFGVSVSATNDRNYSAWVGGSIYGELSSIQCVNKSEYDDSGSAIITKYFK